MPWPDAIGVDGILMLQTADEEVYRPFLELTSRINRLYCDQQSIGYESRLGIERGFQPWHATFNRIPMLKRLRDGGFRGWVLYLDADAYVADLSVDIRRFLAARANRSIVGALGHNKALSDINAGVVFYNFAHPDTGFILDEWQRLFQAEVTDEMLRRSSQPWDFKPNDQDLLQRVLRENLIALWAGIGIEERELFNHRNAQFVRQILRRDALQLADRLTMAAADVSALLRAAGVEPT
ncbi:hypothetical protein [Falsiroseomonas sp. E2-1-a20]|uniref:hypothetical protein n=1 Tax=Falsiroseomonas sp. E2-1-a20 TaxID=3239300 RepID=UPI003F332B08